MAFDDEPGRAWRETERSLPPGWRLDGLRCTSTGMASDQRGDRWRALAVGPAGTTTEGEGAGPVEALADLMLRFGDLP